jgi:hypothetical protein
VRVVLDGEGEGDTHEERVEVGGGEARHLDDSGLRAPLHEPELFSSYPSPVLLLRFLALREVRNSSLRSCTVGAVMARGRRAGRAILLLLGWAQKQEEEDLCAPGWKR